MKYRITVLYLLLCICSRAQSIPSSKRVLLNATETMLPAGLSRSAREQSQNWQWEARSNPQNAAAWFNYYVWTERDRQLLSEEKKKTLTRLVGESRQYISQTPQFSLMLFLHSGSRDSAALFTALSSATDRSWVYPYVIRFLLTRGHYKDLAKYCHELDEVARLPRNLYSYHYNVLMSADSHATIYAKGYNDLVPMAVLQQVYGIRKDIHLRYYEGKPDSLHNSYLCLSLGQQILDQYPQAAYTGLLIKPYGHNTIQELQQHIEKDFDLQHLQSGNFTEPETAQLYKNYLPSLILLYRFYKKTGNAGTGRIQELVQQIATITGTGEAVKKAMEK